MTDLHAVVLGEIDRHERVSGPGLEPVFNALRKAVELHRPTSHRDWTVCLSCFVLTYPPPIEPNSQWTDAVYPCPELCAIADALGVTA